MSWKRVERYCIQSSYGTADERIFLSKHPEQFLALKGPTFFLKPAPLQLTIPAIDSSRFMSYFGHNVCCSIFIAPIMISAAIKFFKKFPFLLPGIPYIFWVDVLFQIIFGKISSFLLGAPWGHLQVMFKSSWSSKSGRWQCNRQLKNKLHKVLVNWILIYNLSHCNLAGIWK